MGRVTGRKPLLAGYGPDFPHYLKCMARTLRFFTCDSTTREAPGPPSNEKPPRQHCTEQCHTLKMTAPPNRRLIGLSTKMYFPLQRTLDFIITVQTQLAALSSSLENVDIFIIPDFISIHPVSEALKSTSVPIRLGAQDCHWDDFGAFTGEVSPVVLRETGVSIVEVGHAERRRIFGETDEVVAKKAAAASRNGMAPLICIGEKTKGDLSIALGECQVQIDQSLADVPETAEVIIAYEPVWAIGASEPASEGHVIGVVKGIRAFESVKRRTGTTRVIYGGSAGPGLFEKLGEAVDGLFLGRFGHDVPRFLTTVSEVASFKA
ncbi:hypothetical protein SGCOL_007860 [Colletotrichum sp. CLE4]